MHDKRGIQNVTDGCYISLEEHYDPQANKVGYFLDAIQLYGLSFEL